MRDETRAAGPVPLQLVLAAPQIGLAGGRDGEEHVVIFAYASRYALGSEDEPGLGLGRLRHLARRAQGDADLAFGDQEAWLEDGLAFARRLDLQPVVVEARRHLV